MIAGVEQYTNVCIIITTFIISIIIKRIIINIIIGIISIIIMPCRANAD